MDCPHPPNPCHLADNPWISRNLALLAMVCRASVRARSLTLATLRTWTHTGTCTRIGTHAHAYTCTRIMPARTHEARSPEHRHRSSEHRGTPRGYPEMSQLPWYVTRGLLNERRRGGCQSHPESVINDCDVRHTPHHNPCGTRALSLDTVTLPSCYNPMVQKTAKDGLSTK